MTPRLYLVGGAIRDNLLGLTVSEYDFAVEANSYEDMVAWLEERGAKIHVHRPEFVGVRAHWPRSAMSRVRRGTGDFGGMLQSDKPIDADFTLCREEAMYHDKRHPSKVTPADLRTDLTRRDFTCNAIALSEDGEFVDPHDGAADIRRGNLMTVGSAHQRFSEDPLRILRGMRFQVTRELYAAWSVSGAMLDCAHLIETVKVERVRDELYKMMRHDCWRTLRLLAHMQPVMTALGRVDRLWVKPTLEDK